MKEKHTVSCYILLLSAIINKNLCNLHMDKDVKRVPTSQPVVSFCSAHKLNSYVVRAKLYPLEKTLGL